MCAIDNSAYRSLNHVDTLTASSSLRQLKEMELLVAKNQGSATYYIPGFIFLTSLSQGTKGHMSFAKGHMPFDEKHMPIEAERGQLSETINEMPIQLQEMIKGLGKKVNAEVMEQAIIALCNWKALSAEELSQILKRAKIKLTRVYLTPMIEKKLLSYKYPEMPKHPNQAYVAATKGKH